MDNRNHCRTRTRLAPRRAAARWAALPLVLVLVVLGCVVVPPDDGGGGGDGGTPADKVLIRFSNLTTHALDVQFYATANAVADVQADLFNDANLITGDIGFAGTGLIPPFDTDQIELDCTSAQSIGTRGGRFVDKNSGEEKGTGTQRWATIDQQYSCGDTITFNFRTDGDGFGTDFAVQD